MDERHFMAFISSTTRDLDAERIDVFRTLINNQCIPVSMESFPPGSRTIEFIQERLRACDFVVLILNNYYGSRLNPADPDSVSYTQREYEYAVAQGIPLVALVRADPTNHPDQSEADWRAFRAFRERVTGVGHIVGMWRPDPQRVEDQLTYHLSNGLQAMRARLLRDPEAGWIRASLVPPRFFPLIEACRQLGIQQLLSDGSHGQEELDRRIRSAREVKIFATTAEPLLRTRTGSLTAALANGARVRVLVATSGSPFVADVQEIEELRDGTVRDLETELSRIRGYLGGYLTTARDRAARDGRTAGTVEVGTYATHFRLTLILCDDWGRATLTIPPHRATTSASFEVGREATQDALLWQFHEHFDYNWQIAVRHGRVQPIRPNPEAAGGPA